MWPQSHEQQLAESPRSPPRRIPLPTYEPQPADTRSAPHVYSSDQYPQSYPRPSFLLRSSPLASGSHSPHLDFPSPSSPKSLYNHIPRHSMHDSYDQGPYSPYPPPPPSAHPTPYQPYSIQAETARPMWSAPGGQHQPSLIDSPSVRLPPPSVLIGSTGPSHDYGSTAKYDSSSTSTNHAMVSATSPRETEDAGAVTTYYTDGHGSASGDSYGHPALGVEDGEYLPSHDDTTAMARSTSGGSFDKESPSTSTNSGESTTVGRTTARRAVVTRPRIKAASTTDGDTSSGKPRKRRRKLCEEPRDQAMRRFKCETCGKAFARPSALKTHDRSHTKIRPHVCPFLTCQRAFAVSCNLRRHQRVYKHFSETDDAAAAPVDTDTDRNRFAEDYPDFGGYFGGATGGPAPQEEEEEEDEVDDE